MEQQDRAHRTYPARLAVLAALLLGGLIFIAGLAPSGASGEQAGSELRRLQAGYLDAGAYLHTCAVLENGTVRCWGENGYGQLGYANTNLIGDNETPGSVGPVDLGAGRTAVAISAGFHHTCALLDNGTVRCWGRGDLGALGYGNTDNIGDDETPGSVGPVDLGAGRKAVAISAGSFHTCAILDNGTVRCWGYGPGGQLGYANTDNIGDDETPGSVGPVDLGAGRKAVAISAGGLHTCAILDNGTVRCWGAGGEGALGYGSTNNIGDDETPGSIGPVDLGAGRTAVAISAGSSHTCAILDNGTVRCWGYGLFGQLGYGNRDSIGDDETPGSVGPVDLGAGRKAVAISAGESQTCAILDNGAVHCWGNGVFGQLGYGNTDNIGDNETPGSVGPVDLGSGRTAVAVSAGGSHTCAVLDNGAVRCWGFNFNGQLGLNGQLGSGNPFNVGDDETPGSVGPVDLGGTVGAPAADLSLQADARRFGHLVLLDLSLRNSGPDAAPGVWARLNLPRGLALLWAKPSEGAYVRSAGVWGVGKVAAGSTARLWVLAVARRGEQLDGSAEVTASGVPDPDSTPGNGAVTEDDFAPFRIRP